MKRRQAADSGVYEDQREQERHQGRTPSATGGYGVVRRTTALGVLGLSLNLRVLVSSMFTARTPAGRAVYELHGLPLTPRPGTITPSGEHLTWHVRQVFKGQPLAA